MKYCPICNRSSDNTEFVGELCIYCFRERRTKELPGKMEVMVCKRCGRVKTPQGYEKPAKSALEAIAAKELKSKGAKLKLKNIDLELRKALVDFVVESEGQKVDIEKSIEVKKINTICDSCYKKAAGYYEAIVQLRGSARKIKKLEEHIERFISKGNAFIAKKEEFPYGIDLYISDKKLIDQFFSKNRIDAKKSYKLYGRKNGKELYRHIFSVQLE
ncbi:MAG: NMD3-related protein [Candidatus Micrarchaeia archaeon]